MNLADMTMDELIAYGRQLVRVVDDRSPHYCGYIEPDVCAAYHARRAQAMADLWAAREEWLTRKNRPPKTLASGLK